MGFVGFRCDRTFRVQPFFDAHASTSEEEVTVKAGNITRRNFTTRVVGRNGSRLLRETSYSSQLVTALPFAHYRDVTFTVSTGDAARALSAKVTAQFVAGTFRHEGYPPLGACYVKRWLVAMAVSPH
jgi:hypothetical protein